MYLAEFYKSVIEALNFNKVQYLIIGGFAVNYHGLVRATVDLDIWINNDETNLENLFQALISLGYSKENTRQAINYFKENHKINIPKENNLIEILDSFMVKIDFNEAFDRKIVDKIENTELYFIGYEELIECKSKSNRFKDLNDVKELKEINEIQDTDKSDAGTLL